MPLEAELSVEHSIERSPGQLLASILQSTRVTRSRDLTCELLERYLRKRRQEVTTCQLRSQSGALSPGAELPGQFGNLKITVVDLGPFEEFVSCLQVRHGGLTEA